MVFILAGDPLAAWGQAAAIILLFYMLVFILIGLAIAAALMLGLSWVREKAELIKRLRPTVDSVNQTAEAANRGNMAVVEANDNKVVRTVAEVPSYIRNFETKVEQGSGRVASAVIEFRARTLMAKQTLKAFFLPGLKPSQQTALEKEGVGFRSPGYRMLVEEKAPEEGQAEYGTGYTGGIQASRLKEAPVEVATTTPKELQNIPTAAPHQDVPIR
ncbi:MAG: hypothetical protein ACJ788_17840 [Ktedonobacteraceae bacterium]